jgi:hypothetical protein
MIERAYYKNSISAFRIASEDRILGELAKNHHFSLDILQKNSWIQQIARLKDCLRDSPAGDIFIEFSIPRMGKRVDVLLVIAGVLFLVEYKVGATSHDRQAIDQVMDYALDLKNFHEGSHDKYIVPILVSTKATRQSKPVQWSADRTAAPLLSNGSDLSEIIGNVLSEIPVQGKVDADKWAQSGYKPTPTIVEAAQALYRDHSIEEISRSEAGARNLTLTTRCISEIINFSRTNLRKSICFVTGVPGAGKTLAGLNIVAQRLQTEEEEHAIFVSGNGPLVIVLREALVRDQVARAEEQGTPLSRKITASKVSALIQSVHHFRDEGLKSGAPIEHVVVFDEAQRAWNQHYTERFMVQKRGMSEFNMSEPEFLIRLMDSKQDWCTIICLIGGGQEINTGEAGLVEWFDALQKHFCNWDVYYSDQITHKDYSWGQDLASKLALLRSEPREALHLAVSVRSFRAETVSEFVAAVIDGHSDLARKRYDEIREDYEILLTRNIGQAREWLRKHARGTERYGLVASSGAIRLKPEGVNVKTAVDPVTWFLNNKDDIRSSYYLEDVATEFDIQGLELDWTGVCWDADFRRERNEWGLYVLKGTRWQDVHDEYRRVYLPNAYRVLLTRARQGMVIFVPMGDERDYTRPPKFYDETYRYLSSCGIPTICGGDQIQVPAVGDIVSH